MSRKPKFSDSIATSMANMEITNVAMTDAGRSGESTVVEWTKLEDAAISTDQHKDEVAVQVDTNQDQSNRAFEPTYLYYDELDTPLGTLTLIHSDSGLCHIKFRSYTEAAERLTEWANRWYGAHLLEHSPDRLADATMQLRQYFAGERQVFDLPLDLRGTDFQLRVWEALCTIPYGEAVSYKHIAEQIGSPAAVRAVGGANNRNPVSIIVPCHRVIGMNGQLVGYGGGLDHKQYLLGLEGWRGMEAEPVLF